MHALITLDNGEVRRAIIPEAIAIPQGMANSYLLAATPFLLAGHKYTCVISKPKLQFQGGGTYTMNVKHGHHIINLTPIDAYKATPHKHLLLHSREPYNPPSFHNNMTTTQNTNRPNAKTPTAFIYHLRYGCASETVLKHTQKNVIGMTIQMGSWEQMTKLLPCAACLAGKMRKTRKAQSSSFTPVQNLALSWTPNTANKITQPNKNISTDWGIINKTSQAGKNNVFALYLDLNTGWTAVYPKPNRGLAGDTLKEYVQDYGLPETILHDNAAEYLSGDFATFCQEKGIKQISSAPYHPNQNPTEHYMDIIMGKTRCLLYISGLDPQEYWEYAITHSVCLQNRTALPGRTTPYQHTFGTQPDISHVRIFGCAALAYLEKEKRHKLDFKTEECVYLGISPRHSHDTHTLLKISTKKVIYRRNVSFNERSFPARINNPSRTIAQRKGSHLIGQTFVDDGETFRVTNFSHHQGVECLDYVNEKTNEEHYSTIEEIEQWVKQASILQLANDIQPT